MKFIYLVLYLACLSNITMAVFRIRFSSWAPWSVILEKENSTIQGGVASEFYKSLSVFTNFRYESQLQKDFAFGVVGENGEWNGMIGSMLKNETDISGPYFISEERSKAIHFSNHIGYSQVGIVSKLIGSEKDVFLILEILSLEIRIYVLCSLVFISLGATFIYATVPKAKKEPKIQVFFKYLFLFQGTVLGKGYGSSRNSILCPVWSWFSFRMLLCLWMLDLALIISFSYQGGITSAFATPKLKPRVSSIQELEKDLTAVPGVHKNTFSHSCMKSLDGTALSSVWHRMENNLMPLQSEEVSHWIKDAEDGNFIMVGDIMSLKEEIGEHFRMTGKCRLRIVPVSFCTGYIAFAFRKHFAEKAFQEFNKRVRWFTEADLSERHIMQSSLYYDICTSKNENENRPLKLEDLIGAFAILGVGLTVSTVALVAEKFWSKFVGKS